MKAWWRRKSNEHSSSQTSSLSCNKHGVDPQYEERWAAKLGNCIAKPKTKKKKKKKHVQQYSDQQNQVQIVIFIVVVIQP